MQCQTMATLPRNDCVEVLPWFGTTGFLLMSLSSAARDLLTTLMIGSALLWEIMLWLGVSVI